MASNRWKRFLKSILDVILHIVELSPMLFIIIVDSYQNINNNLLAVLQYEIRTPPGNAAKICRFYWTFQGSPIPFLPLHELKKVYIIKGALKKLKNK